MAAFRWTDIYRITKAVSRDVPKDEDQVLSWLSTYHFASTAFRDVHLRSQRSFDLGPRSPLGRTVFATLEEMITNYVNVIELYPQTDLKKLLQLLSEAVGAPPLTGDK